MRMVAVGAMDGATVAPHPGLIMGNGDSCSPATYFETNTLRWLSTEIGSDLRTLLSTLAEVCTWTFDVLSGLVTSFLFDRI